MGEPNATDIPQMRRELIASATADPSEFVDRVMENFNTLTARISQADARILELTTTAENQAALITELSMKKDQAKREIEQMFSKARQEAAEIISDAKSQAKQLTNQAETKLINANVEADSIKTTKLNAIRSDISSLESQRLTERDRTLGFLNKLGEDYDDIINQYSQTLAQLKKIRTIIADEASEIGSMNFEHFDIDPYLPHRGYQSSLSQAMPSPAPVATPADHGFSTYDPMMAMPVAQQVAVNEPTQPIESVEPVAPIEQAQPVAQQVPQEVPPPVPSQSGYVDDNGILPASRSFNEAFQMGGQPTGDQYDGDIDEFGDSGLLMEAMAGMDDEQDDFEELAPSDSGLLFDALSSIDTVDEQRDIEEFSEMDDFDEFEEMTPAPAPAPSPAPPQRQRIKVPHRRRSNRPTSRDW